MYHPYVAALEQGSNLTVFTCPLTGARHLALPISRPALTRGVYVGHPISGIRVDRIREMEGKLRGLFDRAMEQAPVELYFPMRSTHLTAADIGANEYAPGASLFSDTRHFTLQNRVDALFKADAVILNFLLADDEGRYRVSKGIPFDLGWARARGKPVVVVIDSDNPNWTADMGETAYVVERVEDAVEQVANLLRGNQLGVESPAIEVFDFSGCGPALSMLAKMAEADARKAEGRCAAIITIMPEGKQNPNWHGQVGQVSDWIVRDIGDAQRVVDVLKA